MTITLAIDPTVRDNAAVRAKRDQLSLSAVARMLLVSYAEGKIDIGARAAQTAEYVVEEVPVDASTQAAMDKVSKAWSTYRAQR